MTSFHNVIDTAELYSEKAGAYLTNRREFFKSRQRHGCVWCNWDYTIKGTMLASESMPKNQML